MSNPIFYAPDILKKIMGDIAKQYGTDWMTIPDPSPDLARTRVLISVLFALVHPEWAEGIYCARCLDPIIRAQLCPACGVNLCPTCISTIDMGEEWQDEEPSN